MHGRHEVGRQNGENHKVSLGEKWANKVSPVPCPLVTGFLERTWGKRSSCARSRSEKVREGKG